MTIVGIWTGDHPRVCGEHLDNCWLALETLGSSPRVRGTQGLASHIRKEAGIIPACAGNTCCRGS